MRPEDVLRHWLVRAALWLLFGVSFGLSILAVAQPTAPELILTVGETPPSGRFEFARVPELVLVRGVAQVVQLGFYQLDPGNPWPPGDLDRASGWLSNRPTRLVDATTGVALPQFGYEERTAELTYNGTWSGDVLARFKEVAGPVQSEPFRIRVLTPTVVYGDNVAAINGQKGWNARLCPAETMSFAACRQQFTGGLTDVAPLVLYITPGSYAGQDWYLSARRYTYVLGDPNSRPTLANDELSGASKAMFYVANLNLINTGIAHTHPLSGFANVLIARNLRQCCETADNNGLVNPNTGTGADQWDVYWHQSESKGMGGVGNTTHAAYIEGRPKSLFDVNNVRILGARGSSGVKTTMAVLNVRHSVLHVAQSPEDLANGTCINPGVSSGCLMHTPIDVPGYSAVTIYANRFEMWRGPTIGVPNGRKGVLHAVVFIRLRLPSFGSDIPAYPNLSWDPPQTSQSTRASPCRNWSGGPETYVADQFWRDVRLLPLNDPANPCTFKHWISYNTFVQLPGSLQLTALRDDGTYPAVAKQQFSPQVNILRRHALSVERATNFVAGNTYEGDWRRYKMDDQPPVASVAPGAFWPRDEPDEFPRVIEVTGELPPWFKL